MKYIIFTYTGSRQNDVFRGSKRSEQKQNVLLREKERWTENIKSKLVRATLWSSKICLMDRAKGHFIFHSQPAVNSKRKKTTGHNNCSETNDYFLCLFCRCLHLNELYSKKCFTSTRLRMKERKTVKLYCVLWHVSFLNGMKLAQLSTETDFT